MQAKVLKIWLIFLGLSNLTILTTFHNFSEDHLILWFLFHLKASSQHPGQFQNIRSIGSYFISRHLHNIQDSFKTSDLLVLILSQGIFTTYRTVSAELLIFWFLFYLKASLQHPGQFQPFHFTPSLQYPEHFQTKNTGNIPSSFGFVHINSL
ncbi:hypothetical protein BU17DRAFT_60250 [Hysterangium stoloniferum]|nr:hypothetical protein BU17DRAFT_60250 [Hysterangium stoloniferum]